MRVKAVAKKFFAGTLAAVMPLTMLPVQGISARAETAEEEEFYYENPMDSLDGLVHAVPDERKDYQTYEIVNVDDRTVLRYEGLMDNPGDFFLIDTNAHLPEAATVEFDMKFERASNNSSKGGFVFGVEMDENNQVQRQTWFASQDISTIRFRKTGAGDLIFSSTNIKDNVWQHWRIDYAGDNIVVTIDGKEEYNGGFPGSQTAEAGLAGFMMWSEGVTYVDNFVARDYEEPEAPDTGDDNLDNAEYIENETIKAALDKTFPQVLRYEMNGTELYGGYSNAEHVAYITDDTETEGTPYAAEVTNFAADGDSAVYTLSIPEFHGGLTVEYSFRLDGSEVVKEITGISGAGEPYLVSFKLNTPVLRVKGSQENAQIAHNVELSPDRYQNYSGDQTDDVSGALKDQSNGTKLTDWAFLYTDGILGTAYNTLIDVPYTIEVSGSGDAKQAALFDREYYYRLAYYPNEDTETEKKLGEMTLVDTEEEFISRVKLTGDTNGNEKIDWQDGAVWIREQLPEMLDNMKAFMEAGGTWQQGHGTFPYNTTSSEVKVPYSVWESEARKMYYLTDGTPQAFAIAGWQQHGHDWHWGDWDQTFSPGAGGNEGAMEAYENTLKYGSAISYHLNQEIVTPDADSYDINTVARDANGNEQMYNSIFGQTRFRNKSYFLDWAAGHTEERMRSFFENEELYWTPVVLYNDQMWDNTSPYNGVYGIHESFAKKKIIDLYKEYGISISIEGLQPTMLRNGVVQWKYYNNPSLITNFIVAGYGTSQMASPGIQTMIFGAKVSSDSRNGNITSPLDFNKAIEDHYMYSAPTFFLRQFTAEEYINNDEMEAVRWSDDVMAKYMKATQSLEFTWGDMTVVSGNDRFIPDLETPEAKIHVYSLNGMAKEWRLPSSWDGVTQVDQYELTSNGQVYITRLDVTDGMVTPVCSAKVPYILVPAAEKEIEPGAVNRAEDAESSEKEATDGDSTTIWQPETEEASLTVDFGREAEFNRVAVEEEGNNISAFCIEAEQDGTWNTVLEGTAADLEDDIVFPSVLGNKVRFTVTDASGLPAIRELKVYADANLSLTAEPTASSSSNYTSVHKDDDGVDVTYTHHADAYSAADDALDTMWRANGTENQYLDMAFNRQTKVNRIVLREEGNNITSFKIQGEIEGTWSDLYTGTTVGELLEINFPASTVEKVRLLVETAEDQPCITEFGIYGVGLVNEAEVAKGNLALNKPAEQSSVYMASNYTPDASKAVDGNTDPRWSSQSISATTEENGAWWQVDLEDTYEISAIKLYSRDSNTDRIGNVHVSVLDENKEVVWTTYMEGSPEPSSATTFKVENEDGSAVQGRYVRVEHPEDVSAMLEIAECEVYEKSDEIETVDKTSLQEMYDDSMTWEEELYTEESWAAFVAARDAAKAVLDDPNATTVEVESAARDLFYARERIVAKPTDKAELTALIEKAKEEAGKTELYTEESLENLNQAIVRAEEDLEKITSLVEEREAVKRLQTALDQLQIKTADKSALEALILSAQEIDLSLYTEESAAAFEAALKAAEDVMADETLTAEDQQTVDDAVENLQAAIDGLVEKPGEPTDPEDPQDPTDPTDPEDPQKPTDPGKPGDSGDDGNGGQNGGKTDDQNKDAVPETGDTAMPFVLLAMVMISGGAVLISSRRRAKR